MSFVVARRTEFIPSVGEALPRFPALRQQVFTYALEKGLDDRGGKGLIADELPHIPHQ
jgi:hypothetical protein